MIRTTLRELYHAPHRIDPDGRVWYGCLTDIDFASEQVGWAVGSGQILRTSDAGKTWINHYSEFMAHASFSPHRVVAPSSNCCWVIDTVGYGRIRCFRTNDAGRKWQLTELEPSAYPKDIAFLDSRRGWIIADDGKMLSSGGQVYVTVDGGKTWETHKLKMKGKPEVIVFISLRQGWLVERVISRDQTRSFGRLHRSNDGGRTWELLATFDRRVLGLTVLDPRRIFVSGENGSILRTRDGGQSWQRTRTGTRATINSIASDQKLNLIAVGDCGTVLISNDEGSNWSRVRGPADGSNCINACIVSPGHVFVTCATSTYFLNAFRSNGSLSE